MKDCGFVYDNNWFRYRTGAIIIKDEKMLFVKSKFADYYYVLGGAVHLGETSENCIIREIFEETNIKAKVESLAVVCENFFKGAHSTIKGNDCHTLEFYYRIKILDDTAMKLKTDEGEDLVWIPLNEIPNKEIKPSIIKEKIKKIITEKNILHIISETDR